MKRRLMESGKRKPAGTLPVVRKFRKVIETRDMSLMNKELYQFLNLYCGFIAHYNIHGFRETYTRPKDFADVFIRHFDRDHPYFNGNYPCHDEPYRETGFTKAELKKEFFHIVERHKEAIGRWAEQSQKDQRYAAYEILRKEFEGDEKGFAVNCENCGNEYEVRVMKEGEEFNDFGIICCPFCGGQIKLY